LEAELAALNYDYRQKYVQIKKFERAWNGQYWSNTPDETDPLTNIDTSPSRHRLSTFVLEVELASHVVRLKNTDCLRYAYQHGTIPGRYRQLDMQTHMSLQYISGVAHDNVSIPYAQIGLDVVLNALAYLMFGLVP
jgi:hypothetical protein